MQHLPSSPGGGFGFVALPVTLSSRDVMGEGLAAMLLMLLGSDLS